MDRAAIATAFSVFKTVSNSLTHHAQVDVFRRSIKHSRKAESLKCRFHRQIKLWIDLRLAKAVCPVPSIDVAQFGGKLLGRRGILQGRVALTVTEDHQPGRIGPCPEIRRILRRIDLRLAVLVVSVLIKRFLAPIFDLPLPRRSPSR